MSASKDAAAAMESELHSLRQYVAHMEMETAAHEKTWMEQISQLRTDVRTKDRSLEELRARLEGLPSREEYERTCAHLKQLLAYSERDADEDGED